MTRRTASARRRRDPDAGTGKGRAATVDGPASSWWAAAGSPACRRSGSSASRGVDLLLLDRDLYNTFQPLLYQVATGGLNPGDVTSALRAFAARFGNAQFRRMQVTGVDAARRCVRTDTGEEIEYDYLVLCCGVSANYFGIPGAEEHARTVYTRADAIEVRDVTLGNLEAYAQGRTEAVEPVVVIVGAGATGIEMAGTLAELRKRGVELRLGTAVKEVQRDGVVLSDGERLPSAVTIWATGVKAHQLAQPAIQGGRHAAAQIRRLLAGQSTEPMVDKDKGTMATIVRNAAVVQLPRGVKLTGRVAWLAWVGLHIVMLVGHRNRLATLANISVRYLAWPGRLNVMVGDPL